MIDKWFGIYCPFHGVWLRYSNGTILHYPAREIAQAHLNSESNNQHLAEVTQFGEEKIIDVSTLPIGSVICPASY